MSTQTEIYPIFDRVLSRADKEARLGQRGCVLWFFGLSGSGKSTLAVALERRLYAEGFVTQLLDGDNVRTGLNRGLGFTDADRTENLRRVAEVAKLHVQAGMVTLCSFITPRRANRAMIREIIGVEDLREIYVHARYETCAARDPKGLYAKVAAGKVGSFTGKDSEFEPPTPEDLHTLTIDTEAAGQDECLARIHHAVFPSLRLSTTPAR